RERPPRGVDEGRSPDVAHGSRSVRQVGEGAQPERLAIHVEALGPDALELPPGLVGHAQLGEKRSKPRTPRAPGRVAGDEQTDNRRELAQPALLAPDAEHLDAVDAGRVAADEEPAPLA